MPGQHCGRCGIIFAADNPEARIGLCKWCDEEERYTPEQLSHLRAEGTLIIPADLDPSE